MFSCPSCSWCRRRAMRSPCRCPRRPARRPWPARAWATAVSVSAWTATTSRPCSPCWGPASSCAARAAVPLLVEAMTYRMQARANADDDTRYRERDEVGSWVADPITRMQRYLEDQGALDGGVTGKISEHAEAMAKRLRKAMSSKPELRPQDLFRFVYHEPAAQLREQGAPARGRALPEEA
ncbi:thiamine pyrophosphate-dependent enzyme [Kocuria rhizophila]|nr:thiamine pyrophosphate-dependent enzyme [Kocuria rhizophila]